MPKCKDIMTEAPMCCMPKDAIEDAINIMKLADVGSVPVIQDHEKKKLIGIITDRDIAVKALAVNSEAPRMLVEEVMSRDLITCKPDDDAEKAMAAMAAHQVRRIPVVDNDGCLIGIIAQGDVAVKGGDEEKTGEVVKEISKI